MPAVDLFTYGGSQAGLPNELRFEGTEVYVRRVGNDVVLSAVMPPRPEALIEALMAFEHGAVIRRGQPAQQQERAPIHRMC